MSVDSILVIGEAVTDKENLARSLSGCGLRQGCRNHGRAYREYQDYFCNLGKHHNVLSLPAQKASCDWIMPSVESLLKRWLHGSLSGTPTIRSVHTASRLRRTAPGRRT